MSRSRRLQAAQDRISRLPFRYDAIDHEYAEFLRTGEVPEDRRLAWAVLERALHARKAAADMESGAARLAALQGGTPAPHRITGSPREQVFHEAVHTMEAARMPARYLIGLLVRSGGDPTDPEFIPSDLELPEFGGLAMRIWGWPDKWVKSPYEPQMQRVMQQHANLRALVDRTEPWLRVAALGLRAFLRCGEVPADDLVRLFALTVGEMFALHHHYLGRGGEDLLASYETVATSTGSQLEAALLHLGKLQARASEERG